MLYKQLLCCVVLGIVARTKSVCLQHRHISPSRIFPIYSRLDLWKQKLWIQKANCICQVLLALEQGKLLLSDESIACCLGPPSETLPDLLSLALSSRASVTGWKESGSLLLCFISIATETGEVTWIRALSSTFRSPEGI